MNVNNFNPFERHVEKIALAVAAVAAGYMIYIAMPPMLSITPSLGAAPVPADQVEPEVSRAVDTLNGVRDATRQLKIRADVDDFVALYKKEMQDQPLPEVLVNAGATPMFVPRNIAIGNPLDLDHEQDLPIATPTVPDPTDPSAIPSRNVFALVMPTAGGPGNPPPQPAPGGVAAPGVPTADKDIVLVRAFEDLGAFLRQMADPDVPPGQHLPPSLQRAVITNVELQRRERVGASWTPFIAVPPSTAAIPVDVDWSKVPDADLQSTLTSVEQQFKQIAEPEYFPLVNGGSIVQQLISGATGSSGSTGAPGAGAATGAPGDAGNPAVAGGPGTTPPYPPAGVPGAVGGAVPGGAPGTVAGADQAKPTAIWAVDDHVLPGKEYQYRIRVSMYNPTYHWPHSLKQPDMKDKAILSSGWVLVPNSVEVQSNMAFFIMGPIGQGSKVSAQVYKWNAGRWYFSDVSVEAGVPITATIKMAGGVTQEVPTGYTVVDVVPTANDVRVVLMDANGNLSSRLSNVDRNSPARTKLISDMAAAAPATRPAPATPRPLFPPTVRPTRPGGAPTTPPPGGLPGDIMPGEH